MEIVFARVAGIDVHKRQVTVAVRVSDDQSGGGESRVQLVGRCDRRACGGMVLLVAHTPHLCGEVRTRAVAGTNSRTGHDDYGRVLHPLTSIFRAAGVRDDLGWARPRDAR